MENWDTEENGDVSSRAYVPPRQNSWRQNDDSSRTPAFGRGRARYRDENSFGGSRSRSDGPGSGGGWSRRGRGDRGEDTNWRSRGDGGSRVPRGGGFMSNRRTEVVNIKCDFVGRIIGKYKEN